MSRNKKGIKIKKGAVGFNVFFHKSIIKDKIHAETFQIQVNKWS